MGGNIKIPHRRKAEQEKCNSTPENVNRFWEECLKVLINPRFVKSQMTKELTVGNKTTSTKKPRKKGEERGGA